MDLSYILNELGEERENYFNAVSPPIIQSSNFALKTVKDFRDALAEEFNFDLYSRGNNPTLNILRKKLAALDGAETKLIFLESPNTFSYELQDLAAVAALAKSMGIYTMIDNSYCSPLYQRPIELGIDLAAQTATKYIGGHSDVVAGVVTGSRELIKKIFENEFMTIGPALSPHSAWLLIRGLRTLPLRIQRSFESTKVVTEWLQKHPLVDKVIWPFRADFTQYQLGQQQMSGCGGLFSFTLKDPALKKIETFCDSLQHILMAVSWGGHESLIIPSIAAIREEDYDAGPYNRYQLIRMYVGLEDPEYLIRDLEQALGKIG